MALTILLSKVFGIYLVVGGIAYVARQKYFMSVMHQFVEDKALRLIVAVAEMVAGLFLIFNHNVWTSFAAGLVSLFGWLMAVEGAFYLLLPDSVVRSLVKAFNTRAWYTGAGIVSVIAGLYLVKSAFGI